MTSSTRLLTQAGFEISETFASVRVSLRKLSAHPRKRGARLASVGPFGWKTRIEEPSLVAPSKPNLTRQVHKLGYPGFSFRFSSWGIAWEVNTLRFPGL